MRIYDLNEKSFEIIDSHDIAWVCGWIASDGCIFERNNRPQGVHFGLKECDKYILEMIKNIVGYTGPLYFYDRTKHREKYKSQGFGNGKNQWRLNISSQKLANDLIKLGMEPRKSMTMGWIEVPEEFMSSYLQGFFEGDGSIYLIKHPSAIRDYIGINFTGTEAYLIGLKEYLNKNVLKRDIGYIRKIKIKNGLYYQLVYSGDDSVDKLMGYFYAKAPEGRRLNRKYDLYCSYKASLPVTTTSKTISHHSPKSTNKHMITAFGITQSLTDWSEWDGCACSRQALYHRIFNMELDPEYALTTENLKYLPPSTAKLNYELADEIRENKEYLNLTNSDLASMYGVSSDTISSILNNHVWKDDEYVPSTNNTIEKTIYIDYNGESKTLAEWSRVTGIPKTTLDRRLRKGLSIEQVMHTGEKRLNLGREKSNRDEDAYAVAKAVREAYRGGLVGKSNYDKFGISKSKYIDYIGNRVCKEEAVWWK